MTTSAVIWTKTNRGFILGEFEDDYHQACSIQESSGFKPRIWFGVDDMLDESPIPEQKPYEKDGSRYVHVNARMHLSPEQVALLIPTLQFFVDNGRLPNEDEI